MDMEVTKTDEIIFLKPLKQNIDATASTQFKARVIDLINQGNHFFLLNLSEVEFVDSSGLGAMISILKLLKLNNGDLVLCNLNVAVLNLFNLTRMTHVFNISTNEKDGLESLVAIRNKLNAH